MVRVNQKVKEGVGWYDSRLSRERQRVINYYNGSLPKRQHLGSSQYISTDVYDAVESMKAQLVETFAANPDNLVAFPANGPGDVEAAREATEYCNDVFFTQNDGYGLLEHLAHDGLTARTGVVKVYWEESKQDTEEEIPAGTPAMAVHGLAAQPEVSELDADADDDTGLTFHGKLTRTIDTSRIHIDPIPPEEFLITPRCPDIHKADMCSHRTLKSKGELKKLYPKRAKLIDELHYDDDRGLDLGPEVLARNMPVETVQALDNPIQPELEKVMLYESYVFLDIHNGKGMKLYKVIHVNEVLLDEVQEVARRPFKFFVPIPIPYMFYGNNFAARCIPYQNARTVLTRAILDHTAITTNPRYMVVKGGLLNPKELIENRLGGIVNIARPDAVMPMAQAQLNQYVFPTLEMLKSNKEESTGQSALSMGLNKDAISTQNSDALVDNLVNLSMIRQKTVARNLAKCIASIYVEIYSLVLENQGKERKKVIQVAGNFVPISTEGWIERTECKIALHVGYKERDREVAKYQALYQSMANDQGLAPMFQPQNRYKLATDAMKAGGFQNYADYISPPASVKPPQPDPLKVQELQIKDKEAQAALLTAQSAAKKVAVQQSNDAFKQQIEEINMHLKTLLGTRAEVRKDAEVKSRIDVQQREMTLLEKHPPNKDVGTVAA